MKARYIVLGLLLVCAIPISQAAVELPDGIYHQSETEMVIKTAGLDFEVTRTWYQGRWQFNINWDNLTPEYYAIAGVAGRSAISNKRFNNQRLKSLSRGRYKYNQQANGIFVYDEKKRIEITGTGYRWLNRKGDWIDYDASGRATQYGFREHVQGVIVRDSESRVIGLQDPQGQQILTYEYNSDNQVIAISDNSVPARRATYRYENGQLVEAIDVLGISRFYQYDNNQLTQYTDGNGNPTHLAYHHSGRVKSVLDQSNIGWNYVYDYDKVKKEYYVRQAHTSGRTLEIWFDESAREIRKDENGQTVQTIKYDPYNQKETYTDRMGQETIQEYDAYRNLIKTTYPDGTFTTRKVDLEYSNVTEEVNENGFITRYEYNVQGHRTATIEAVGTNVERRTEYQVNDRGWVTQIKRVADAVTAESIVNYQYDTAGNLIQFTDALGHVTTYTYDNAGNRLTQSEVNEQGLTVMSSFQYDAKGQIIRKQQPDGQFTINTYDGEGNRLTKKVYSGSNELLNQMLFQYDYRQNLIRSTANLGSTITYQYDELDNLIQTSDSNGDRETYKYDLFNRMTDKIDEVGYKTSWKFHLNGLVSQIEHPTFVVNRSYDKRGRLLQKEIQSKLPDASNSTRQTIVYTYDNRGRLLSMVDAKGRTSQYHYDALNRLIQSIDTAGAVTSYTYDNRNNLLSVTDPNGNVIRRHSYDANNNVLGESKAEGQQSVQEYNELGMLSQSTDAMGQVSRYTYNARRQITRIELYESNSAASPLKTIHFTYNDNGLVQSYDDGNTSATYQYNVYGQKVGESINYGPFTKSNTYSYDASGLKSSFTNAEGFTVNYQYKPDGQIEQIELPDIGYITYHYNNSDVEQISFPGNTNQYWRYDGLLRPESILVQDISQSVLDSRDYQYDKANNVVEQIIREGKLAYQYNHQDRLSQVDFTEHQGLTPDHNHNTSHLPQDEQYSYDSVGNRLTSHNTQDPWQYNTNNELLQYTQAGKNISFQYNANGQMVGKTEAGISTYYEYDINNRLQVIKNHEQQLVASYSYDPFGRRISKTIYTSVPVEGSEDEIISETTYFHYNQEGLIAEYDQQGNLIQSYGYAPDSSFTTKPLYTYRPDFGDSAGHAYYINDHLGTPQKLITNNGRMVWFGERDSYGNTQQVIDEFPNPLRFPGQYFDNESGMHYNFYRYYIPELGRYLTSDPIGLFGGINTYAYANANPLKYIDSYGLKAGEDNLGSENKNKNTSKSRYERCKQQSQEQYDRCEEFRKEMLFICQSLSFGASAMPAWYGRLGNIINAWCDGAHKIDMRRMCEWPHQERLHDCKKLKECNDDTPTPTPPPKLPDPVLPEPDYEFPPMPDYNPPPKPTPPPGPPQYPPLSQPPGYNPYHDGPAPY